VLNDMGVPLLCAVGTARPGGGQIRSESGYSGPRIAALGVAREPPVLEHIDDALPDIDEWSGGRLDNAEVGDQAARGAAMRRNHCVPPQILVPASHARCHRFITLTAGRHETPFVVLARRNALRIAFAQLRDGEALPFAEGDFEEPGLTQVAVGGKTKAHAHQFHCLASATERTRYVIETSRISTIAREQIAQDSTAMDTLRTATRIQRHVMTSLQTAGDVPISLTVTDVIDGRRRRRRYGHGFSRPYRRQCPVRRDASCRRYDSRRRHDGFLRSHHSTCQTINRLRSCRRLLASRCAAAACCIRSILECNGNRRCRRRPAS